MFFFTSYTLQFIVLSLSFVAAAQASASEDVVEIESVCAVQTGCFSGDDPGYPVTIDGSAGKSYRLTGDLIVSASVPFVIQLAADDVTLDLGGFSIIGPTVCSGDPTGSGLLCNETGGSAVGILASPTTIGTRVRNGTVRGMKGDGASLGKSCHVSRLRVFWNTQDGLRLDDECRLDESSVIFNVGDGVSAYNRVQVSRSTVALNGQRGVLADRGLSATESIFVGNGSDGVYCLRFCRIHRVSASHNGGSGVFIDESHANISEVVAHANGQDGIAAGPHGLVFGAVTGGNGGSGVSATTGTAVQETVSRANGVEGLLMSQGTSYFGNTVGTVSGGIDVGANSCAGTGSCP